MTRVWLTRLAWFAMAAIAAFSVLFAGWFIWLLANVPKFSNYHTFG